MELNGKWGKGDQLLGRTAGPGCGGWVKTRARAVLAAYLNGTGSCLSEENSRLLGYHKQLQFASTNQSCLNWPKL